MGLNISNLDSIKLDENEDKLNSLSYTTGTWLLTTKWGQHDPYHEKTPADSGGNHYRLGCWSVAIGQIIRFHELQSHGEVIYLWGDLNTLVNDLDTFTYDWDLIPDELNASSSPDEIDHVSQLLYDAATVIQKNWGTMGYCLNSDEKVDEIIDHFQYISVQTEFVNNPPISDIIDEIDHHRPCMLYLENIDKTSGHAVAIDGYQMGRNFEVHLNMGWNGGEDGFYEYDKPISIYDNNSVRGVMFIRLSPSKPHKPAGPNVGAPDMEYNFTTQSTAPKDPIYYKWDWGDGTFSDWLGRYNSDEICETSHTWKEKGNYNIRAKARDVNKWESPWSDPFAVSMPRNKPYINTLLLKFLNNHPHMFQLLRQLLNLQ